MHHQPQSIVGRVESPSHTHLTATRHGPLFTLSLFFLDTDMEREASGATVQCSTCRRRGVMELIDTPTPPPLDIDKDGPLLSSPP